MADNKSISDLSDGGFIQDVDYFVISRSGSDYKISGDEIDSRYLLVSIDQTSSPYSVAINTFLLVDCTLGDVTVNLPSVVGSTGRKISVAKVDTTSNKIILSPDGSDTINGKSSVDIYSDNQVTEIIGGSEWRITQPGNFNNSILGNPGNENSGINVGGTTFNSVLKVSDIGGTFPAEIIFHKHSTTFGAALVASRSNSDTASHSSVTSGMDIFNIVATGWAWIVTGKQLKQHQTL